MDITDQISNINLNTNIQNSGQGANSIANSTISNSELGMYPKVVEAAGISPAALMALSMQQKGKVIPIYCGIHGHPLDFYCFDDHERICIDCISLLHTNHRFDFITTFLNGNHESLEYVRAKAQLLHVERQSIHDSSYRNFKTQIRTEVLSLKKESVQAIEEASSRILQLINKGELKNFEKEMEIYQNFAFNKIINF